MKTVEEKVKEKILADVAAYSPEHEANRSGGLGAPLSKKWHESMLEDFENALVEPEWIKVSMTDNKVVNCLAITKEASGYRVAFIPEGDEFLLACNGTSGWCCIGVRGGAVDTFAAI